MFEPWVALSLRLFQLSVEAQSVMALRLMRLASGDARGQDELNRMVVEKLAALAEAQMAAATAIMNGHKDHVVARKALTVFRKRVRENKRRLLQADDE
jgi:alpha-beta hydrolase superfamily lysophospholipase